MADDIQLMQQETYFRKCSFCNVFQLVDDTTCGNVFHVHDYTQIWYIVRGTCEHYMEDQLLLLSTGDTFLVPPKITHKTLVQPGSIIICCDFILDEVLPQSAPTPEYKTALDMVSILLFLQDSKSRHPRFTFRPESGRQVEQLMRQILLEYQQELPCYEDMLRLKIQELLLLFVREFRSSASYSSTDALYLRYRELMDKAIHYIDHHYAEALTLDDACRISTLSRTYFCYLFKLITKKTFVEYLTDVRIRNALQMLDTTTKSIQEISEALGFHDAAHFSRTFKKSVGSSPRAYRKLRSGNGQEDRNRLDPASDTPGRAAT